MRVDGGRLRNYVGGMTQNLCPTCGRRPSERGTPRYSMSTDTRDCQDPIHDLADRAPELEAELKRTVNELGTGWDGAQARVRELEAEQRRYYEESCDLAVQKGDQRQRAEKAETRCAEMRAALEKITLKEGAFSTDPFSSALNCVDDMAEVARAALEEKPTTQPTPE